MRTATAKEYAQAARGQKRQMHTRRTTDVYWTDRGTEVASKHEVRTRGKVTSVSYMVNPDYLPKTCVKCTAPIHDPQLAASEPERCEYCADPE